MTQKRMLKFVPQAFFGYNTVREIERTKTKPTYTYSPSREQCARVTPHRSTTVGVIPWSSQHSVWNLQKSTRSQKIPTKLSFGAIFFVDLISVRFLVAHFPSPCVSIAAVATFLHAGHQREGDLNRNRQPANRIPRGRIYRALPFLPTAGWTIPPVQWKEYHRVAEPFGKVILDDWKKKSQHAHTHQCIHWHKCQSDRAVLAFGYWLFSKMVRVAQRQAGFTVKISFSLRKGDKPRRKIDKK